MGMFDSVYVTCPKCGGSVEFQSKAGECLCINYAQGQVPAIIAADLDGDSEFCRLCGEEIVFCAFSLPEFVSCVGLQYDPDNEESEDD